MATPFLSVNYRSGTPQLRRYVNATPSTVGVTFGSADNNTGTASPNQLNCRRNPIQFGGSQTFLCLVGGVIYRTTNNGASWTSVKTTTFVPTLQSFNTGFHIVYNSNGVETAVVIGRTNTGTGWVAEVSTDGTTWTTISGTDSQNTTGVFTDSMIYNNKIYCLSSGDGGSANMTVGIFDPAGSTFTFIPHNAPAFCTWAVCSALCQYQDRIFTLNYTNNSAATAIRVYEIIGSTVTLITTFAGSSSSLLDSQVKYAMFSDGTYMYALYIDTTAATRTWKLQRFDSALTTSDISSVLPATMTGGNPTTRSRCFSYYDAESNPGGTPVLYVINSNGGVSTDSYTMWAFSNSSTWTLVDSGGSSIDTMIGNKESGGEYNHTTGDANVALVGKRNVAGGIELSYKVTANAFTGTVTVTNGANTLSGSGTLFTSELAVGMGLEFSSQPGTYYAVATITNDTTATLSTNYTGATTAGATMTRVVGIKGFYGNNLSPFPNSAATLSNPDFGTLVGSGAGNRVAGIPCDGTTRKVTWAAGSETPPFTTGSRAKIQLEQIAIFS